MITFSRVFTDGKTHPYDTVTWEKRVAAIPGSGFIQENVEFPSFYSQTSTNIVSSKYFQGKIGTKERESSLKQLIDRVVNVIVDWGEQGKYFTSVEQKEIFMDEYTYILLHQYFSHNSPVWFNFGSPFRKGKYQASACYILSAEDTMDSILENVTIEGNIFKYGSGAGSNRSKLRSSYEDITGGGKSSGPCSFMKIYDSVASVTKSGGISRRAAKMEILNDDHGDIFQFISLKSGEEEKAKALIAAGFDSRFDSANGAYSSVFFQNSNFAVRCTDKFMQAVDKDETWALLERAPRELLSIKNHTVTVTSQGTFLHIEKDAYIDRQGKYYKVLAWHKAKDILNKIASEAHKQGDPTIQFHDTVNKWNTVKADGDIDGSNPCSEYVFLDNTSCNLGSLNLVKFIEQGQINLTKMEHVVHIVTTAMDITIQKAHFPIEKVKKATQHYRPLGVGYANLGALLMSRGIAYDSDLGRSYASAITAFINAAVYKTSNELADTVGAFAGWEKNKESMYGVLCQHKEALHQLKSNYLISVKVGNNELAKLDINALISAAGDWYIDLTKDKNKAFRNAQATCLAPTGTIAFMMDCDTTGIEPGISLVSYKKLVGGGELTLVLGCVKDALKTLHYSDQDILDITNGILQGKSIHQLPVKSEHIDVFATSLSNNSINSSAHVKMMAAVQPFLSGAISKTVNLPNNATVSDIEEIYKLAWKLGLKGIAVYRDMCRASQPVNTTSESAIKIIERNKLPDTRESITHKFDISGHEGYITVGKYPDGRPGELFLRMSKDGSTISGLLDAWATALSLLLQYGAPLSVIVDKFKHVRFEPAGITKNKHIRIATSTVDYIARYLDSLFNGNENTKEVEVKSSIIKTSYDGPPCVNCGNITSKNGSCFVCDQCGETTGCS